ncbi:MAG TPA: crosslink repair DNA glycosylase YcaQ family protein [Nocardioides sp.]|uniref:winged helix-turn-helix domain-containing protein n=1 Tax=Nocardioides sp. TaxID=35761 RepID=UPI002D1A6073|nr:crosslink repair DNA glycosylase YcaQ family protein [Nocardioides sp.]HTW17897.1 crosslink repair DNA glycosylase YcaQ family protein [Nocardioides sp.]
MPPESLSQAQARRVALGAQGFLDRRHAVPTMRTLHRTLSRTGVLQVDSVNVLQRAHYMPLYSRMGPYDVELLRRASERRPRRLVEYWAHVQAFMPVELWPHMQHRMEAYRERRGKWMVLEENPQLEASLLEEIRERGASTARELDDGLPRAKEEWGWNWSLTRQVLDYLFTVGDLAIAGRNSQFEVLYDLPERVIPAEVLARPTPTRAEASLELVRRAAVSHGVATAQCLKDYFRMHVDDVRPAVTALVESGELVPVTIEGWKRPAYLHRDARLPRRVGARALLSPFDPVVWERERTERIFDFHYRIEIYTPAEKRVYGYYVLPFLLGDRIVARVDLKADRKAGVLVVKAAYAEPGAPVETASELAAELAVLAGWLGLGAVAVEPRGDLAPALAALAALGV